MAADRDLGPPQVVASGLETPWGLAFLPDGDALVSERDTGRILRLHPGSRPQEVMRIAGVHHEAEDGLLGLAVSPNYATDHLVFAYYSTAGDNRLARFTLGGKPQVILKGLERGAIHDGGRIAFGPDGMLYVPVGDAGDRANSQNRSSRNGKILRIRPDGSVPPDNPFGNSPVYSYGHRNIEGLAWDLPGRLWSSELGQNSWDELNLIQPGRNYGWPEVEGSGDTRGGRFTNPLVTWRTSDASPSGLAYWRGALYMASLRGQSLWQIPLDPQGRLGKPRRLFDSTYGRLRTVVVAPDGSLWLSTSNTDGRGNPAPDDDRLLRFSPR